MANFTSIIAALGIAMTAQASHAAERWVCKYVATADQAESSAVSFLATDAILIEGPHDVRYNILENNEHALLAEHHFGDFDPVLVRPNIFLMTVMIDKATRQLTFTTAVSGQKPTLHFGRCERRDMQLIINPTPETIASK
jgi:hypothetical protein